VDLTPREEGVPGAGQDENGDERAEGEDAGEQVHERTAGADGEEGGREERDAQKERRCEMAGPDERVVGAVLL
jgi:hypothetical protein